MCTRSTGLDTFSATHLGIPATFWKLFALLDDFSPSPVWRLVCARARIRAEGTTEQGTPRFSDCLLDPSSFRFEFVTF